jgi:hypothetical protein
MAFEKGHKFATGGARVGAGRKKSEYHKLKARLEQEKLDAAERAVDLYIQVMDSHSEPLATRLAAADWIANRIMGQPKAKQELQHSGKIIFEMEYVNDWRDEANQIADATFRAKDDLTEPSTLQMGERGQTVAQDDDGAASGD